MSKQSKFLVNWSGRGHAYTDAEIETVSNVMRSTDSLTQASHQMEFENRFSAFVESPHAFAVSSCTGALELSALLSGVGPGDEVILPAHTFAATAIPFARTGATLRWADIDPNTRVVTAETIQPLVSEHTKVIIAVHLYGLVCDMDPIMELAHELGAYVVEDAAQSLGAHYKGRPAGSIGDFGCFSFHSHKNITTLGEGGMLTVRDPDMAKLVPGLRHNGMRAFDGERPLYWLPAMSNVDFDVEGLWPYNFCLGEVQCALGTKLLDRLDEMVTQRATRAKMFAKAVENYPEIVLQTEPEGCGHTHHLLAFRYDGPVERDRFMQALAFEQGIQAVVQYCPLYRYPLFQRGGFGQADCPETDRFFDNMVSLPFHHWLTDEDFKTVIDETVVTAEQMRREAISK